MLPRRASTTSAASTDTALVREEVGDAGQNDPLRHAVEGGVEERSEGSDLLGQTRERPVEHVEDAGDEDQDACPDQTVRDDEDGYPPVEDGAGDRDLVGGDADPMEGRDDRREALTHRDADRIANVLHYPASVRIPGYPPRQLAIVTVSTTRHKSGLRASPARPEPLLIVKAQPTRLATGIGRRPGIAARAMSLFDVHGASRPGADEPGGATSGPLEGMPGAAGETTDPAAGATGTGGGATLRGGGAPERAGISAMPSSMAQGAFDLSSL